MRAHGGLVIDIESWKTMKSKLVSPTERLRNDSGGQEANLGHQKEGLLLEKITVHLNYLVFFSNLGPKPEFYIKNNALSRKLSLSVEKSRFKSTAELSTLSFKKENPKLSIRIIAKMKILAQRIRALRPIKEMVTLIENNCKLAEEIEEAHNLRVAAEAERGQTEEKIYRKAKDDLLRWMHVPFASNDNSLLNKMIRIRLLEVLSDV